MNSVALNNMARDHQIVRFVLQGLRFISEPHRLYVAIAGVFGLLFVFLTPPTGAGDEPAHFERIYEVTSGQWLGAEGVPFGISEFLSTSFGVVEESRPFTGEELAALKKIDLDKNHISPYENPYRIVLRIHNPIAYLVYMPAMSVGLAFDLKPSLIFTLCRLTTLLAGIALMCMAIRVLPAHKHLAVLVALMPTSIAYLSAVNIDAFLLGAAFLFFALVVRHSLQRDILLTTRDVAILSLVALFIGIAKTPYVFLPLLTILLPQSKFKTARSRLASIAAIFFPGFFAALLWAVFVKTYMLDGFAYSTVVGGYVQSGEQLALMLSNPFLFAKVLFATLTQTDTIPLAVKQAVGVMGWNTVPLPAWAYVLVEVAIILLWVSGRKTSGPFASRVGVYVQGGLFLTILTASFFFLYLQWTGVGASTIEGFQGRYFLPILPLLFFAAPARIDLLSSKASRSTLTAGASVTALAAAAAALAGYYHV